MGFSYNIPAPNLTMLNFLPAPLRTMSMLMFEVILSDAKYEDSNDDNDNNNGNNNNGT